MAPSESVFTGFDCTRKSTPTHVQGRVHAPLSSLNSMAFFHKLFKFFRTLGLAVAKVMSCKLKRVYRLC